jgi:hypothetical protein
MAGGGGAVITTFVTAISMPNGKLGTGFRIEATEN